KHLIYSKKPYPGLVRLLEHTDILVASDAIASIFLLLETGSNTSAIADPHPHYESILSCDGIKKIFDLFQKNISKYSRDRTALCIGYLFRARMITDSKMRQEVINHLKSLLCDSNNWVKENSKTALKQLSQNEENRSEILNDEELKRIEKDLKKPCNGTEEQKNQIFQKQENCLLLLSSTLIDLNDNELRKPIISSGIVENILFIFKKGDFSSITRTYSQAFLSLVCPSSNEIKHLIYSKKPYPGLVRLLEHTDILVASDAIASIFLLLE
ncbi:MAG: hypothetical protein EZS28_052321, partial [Streblomastix strix]